MKDWTMAIQNIAYLMRDYREEALGYVCEHLREMEDEMDEANLQDAYTALEEAVEELEEALEGEGAEDGIGYAQARSICEKFHGSYSIEMD